MIFIFKRRIQNGLRSFMGWFRYELSVNYRFREVYLQVVEGEDQDQGQYLAKQWQLSHQKKQALRAQIEEQKQILAKTVPKLLDSTHSSKPQSQLIDETCLNLQNQIKALETEELQRISNKLEMVFEQAMDEMKQEGNKVLHTKLYKLKISTSLTTSISQLMKQVDKMRHKQLFAKDRSLCLKFATVLQEIQCLLGDFILALSRENLATMAQICYQISIRCSLLIKNHKISEEAIKEITRQFKYENEREITLNIPINKFSIKNAEML